MCIATNYFLTSLYFKNVTFFKEKEKNNNNWKTLFGKFSLSKFEDNTLSHWGSCFDLRAKENTFPVEKRMVGERVNSFFLSEP